MTRELLDQRDEARRDALEMERHSILGPDEPECRTCPKCHSGDFNQREHLFDVTEKYSLPDCTWWVCEDCGYETEPE